MKKIIYLFLILLLTPLSSTTAHALGPIDGDIGIGVWSNDFDADLSDTSLDVGTTVLHGELWLANQWGLRGAVFDADLEGDPANSESRTQFEVRRRFLSAGDNNFFAMGIGLEDIDFENGSSASGLRLGAEARLGILGPVYFYGRVAIMPDLGDAGSLRDVSGEELEAGVHVTPFPFLSLKFGYLVLNLDYETAGGTSVSADSSGLLFSVGFHW